MPYVIGLTIQYPSGTDLANVQVILRNEANNLTSTKTTNSSGEVQFVVGEPGGDIVGRAGDVVSWVIFYTGYEGYGSHTILSGRAGYTTTVVLTAAPTAPTLRYFYPQDFLDFFNKNIYEDDNENGVKLQRIVKVGEMAEAEIDSITNSKFDSNSGSYYTVTNEYHDGQGNYDTNYFLFKRPVISISSLQTSQSEEDASSPTWDTLTADQDYFIDLETGRVALTDSTYFPEDGARNRFRCTYTYGRATVPADIKLLAILWTGVLMFGATHVRNKIADRNDSTLTDIEWFDSYKISILNRYRMPIDGNV